MRLGIGEPFREDSPAFSRRKLLAAIAAGGLAVSIPGGARGGEALPVRHRWQTGNNRLYPFLLSGQTLFLNGDATLEAWDLGNGRQRWHYPLVTSSTYRPRMDGEWLLSAGRSLLGVHRALDGSQRWEYRSEKDLGVPLLHHGQLFVGKGHRLLSLDLSSGKQRWSFSTHADSRIAYAPVVYGKTLLLGSGDGQLYALDVSDGRLLWHVDREHDWQYLRQLHLSGEVLVAGGYHDELFGIHADNGEILWRFDAGNFVNSHIVNAGLACFWSPTGWIYALDARTGTIVWRHRTTNYRRSSGASNWAPMAAELQVRGKQLYALTMDHILHVLDMGSGDEIARYSLPVAVRNFISLGPRSNDLFFGSEAGEILHIQLARG